MNPDHLPAPHPTFRVLGPVSVWDGESYQPLPASKPVSMLATLLTSPNEVTSNEFLLRAVWGDEADVDARSALRTCTTRLRKLLVRHNLGDDLIQTVSGGYRLRAGVEELDLLLFREHVVGSTRLEGVDPQVRALRGALDLWQGSLLCNVGSDVLHRGVVPLLEEERLQVLERIVDLLVRDGRDQEALAELQLLTRSHEGHERFALQLVGVLYRAGRREDALAECTRMKQYLSDELGLDPTPELTAAEMAILTGQPMVPGATAPPAPTATSLSVAAPAVDDTTGPAAAGPVASGVGDAGGTGGTVHLLRPAAVVEEQPPAPAPTLPTSRSLLGSSGFVGREDELDRLVNQLTGRDGVRSLCLLVGSPGVGKTSLALHAAARVAEHVAGHGAGGSVQAMVRMRDHDDRPRDREDVVADLAAQLGPGAHDTSTSPGLLLLDDAVREQDVAAIADAYPHRSVLITTGAPMLRLVRTHGALVHRVEELQMADALALLGRLLGPAGVAEDMLAAYDIVTHCWRNPLALRVFAATLQTRPAWGLSAAAQWLREDPVARLSGGAGDLSLAAYFDLAMLRLEPPLPDVVTRLSALDDDGFSLREAGDALDGDRFGPPHQHLDDLVNRGWLDELAPGTFRVDPLVRAFALRSPAPARGPSAVPVLRPCPALDPPQEGAR
ncbi:AAA family ATPase [Nocardioides dongxiaopingii]|uniref:BTAD domain-containing putative transcriptional regulator n=1 Tax=Nocardioides sp. S-1144 TaxID=2582905 RepID=UPI00110F1034|nr:BTAD domain-containing putative transcriptional regulator [Nocardioides sp. S-1144]QCW49577.1 AAA family ATPase [Nocardioides sp. S-1144]